MTGRHKIKAILLIFFLSGWMGVEFGLFSGEYYLKNIVVANENELKLSDLLVDSVDIGDTPVFLSEKPSLIPLRKIKDIIEKETAADFTLVGSRFVYIPEEFMDPENNKNLVISILKELNKIIEDKTMFAEIDLPESICKMKTVAKYFIGRENENNEYEIGISYYENDELKKEYFSIGVTLYNEVAYSNKYLKVGDGIRTGDLVFKENKIEINYDEPVFRTTDLRDLELKRSISRDILLKKKYFRKIRIVSTGDNVKIIFKKGNVVITDTGIILKSAGSGEITNVRFDTTGKIKKGIVKNSMEVWIE